MEKTMSTLQRTKISQDKFGGKDVIWLSDLYTIDEVITMIALPVLVKVVDGYMINEVECLETNTLLSVHGYSRREKFTAIDQQERRMKIPTTCKYEAMVRPNVTIPLCKTAGDVSRQPKAPKFITNELEFRREGKTFPASTIFLVESMDKIGTLSVVCLTDKPFKTKLPATTKGHFREAVHPDDRQKRYLMKDLVKHDLPLSVEFQPQSGQSGIYSPRMGTVRLKELITTDIVYATTYENGRRLLITFSRGLNIKVQIGRVIVEADGDLYSTIAEPTEDEIDNEVLEHILHLDPYNGDYINVDYEVVLQQLNAHKYEKSSTIDNTLGNKHVATVDYAQEKKAPVPPERPLKPPHKPPRVPPRNRTEDDNSKYDIEKQAPLDNDSFKAIQGLNSSIQNKYVTAPKLPPEIPAKLPPALPPVLPPATRKKPKLNSPEKGPKSAQAAVAPSRRPRSQEEGNLAFSPRRLDHSANVRRPQSEEIVCRPPLLPPRQGGIHVQEGANEKQSVGYRKMTSNGAGMMGGKQTDVSALTIIPSDKLIFGRSSADTKKANNTYESVAVNRKTSLPMDTTLMDTTLMSQKLQEKTALNRRYEEVTLHMETLPVDTSLESKNSAQPKNPNLAYEEIGLFNGNQATDTTLTSANLAQERELTTACEEKNLPGGRLPVDNTLISSKLAQSKESGEPSGAYEEITIYKETLPIGTTLSNLTVTEPGADYEEITMREEAGIMGERSQIQVPVPISSISSTAVQGIDRHEDNRTQRGKQRLNSQGQESGGDKNSVQGNSIETNTNTDQLRIDPILKELAAKGVDEICSILDNLQLGEFKESFISNQIDGELLIDIKEEDLVADVEMNLFQARKLSLYMRGWKPDEERPDYQDDTANEDYGSQTAEEEDDKPVETWRIGEVWKRMLSIKLSSFADFCNENQVNGSLLKGILDNDVIDSIRSDHNIKLSRIEERKLINYVTKGWRPKSMVGLPT